MKIKLRNIVSVLLLIAALMLSLAVGAYALQSYGTDEASTLNQFIDTYGWDRNKMKAYEWTGNDGQTYRRYTEYESAMYDDIYTTNEELAITLGLITPAPVTGGNGASMVAVALAEWEAGICETPMGSNNVKYNTWYYNRVVSGESYPWCCAFISWCANECGLLDTGTYTKTAGCAAMRSHFISREYEYWGIMSSTPYGGTETPIPGDIIIWAGGAHIGLIVKVNEDSIETVEGNAGDRVSHNTYTAGNAPRGAEVFRVQYPDNETTIFNYLVRQMDLPPAAAVGVVANISCESNFNSEALGDNGTSYGICQWHLGRWDGLKSFCDSNGLAWEGLDGQLAYLQYELENVYPGLLNKLRSVSNTAQGAYDAAFAWCHDFERPQGYEYPTSNYRGNLARGTFWPKYSEFGWV